MAIANPPRAQLIYTDVPGSLPADYVIPSNLDLDLSSAFAKIDGTSAASAFLPCLTLLSQDGKIIARVKQDDTYQVGDTGDCTWSPFLKQAVTGSTVIPQLGVFDRTLTVATTSVDTTGTDLSGGHVLEVWAITRTDETGAGVNLNFQFNSDTGANYDFDWVRNQGGAVNAVDTHGDTAARAATSDASYAAHMFAVNRLTIPGYDQASTDAYKVGEFTGYVPNTSTNPPSAGIRVYTGGLVWRNQGRITSVQFGTNATFQFQPGSRFLILRR